jgi:hypothetical protein
LTLAWRAALLLPHGLALAAFAAAFIVMGVLGTNRSQADLWLGLTGFGCGALALLAAVAVLIAHPWRGAESTDWAVLAAHGVGVLLVLAAGGVWLGAHIA